MVLCSDWLQMVDKSEPIRPVAAGLWGRDRVDLEVDGNERYRGRRPRTSGDQARQTIEEQGKDPVVGSARRQVDLELGFQLDDAGGEFDEAQPQGVELYDSPRRAFGHETAHRP